VATVGSADQELDLSEFRYKAFLSYSHGANAMLAPSLKSAVERFATPWYKRRSLSIFLDKSSLALTPKLWSSIESALLQSEYLILLASPQAAASEWVKTEVGWWLSRRSVERILIVCTGGEISWDRIRSDFDWGKTTALPRILSGHFAEEPQYLDLRWIKKTSTRFLTDDLFYDGIASISAVLRGKSKEEISGENLRQHKRTIRHIFAVAIAMFLLLVTSLIATYVARTQTALAERRLRAATARELASASLNSIYDSQLSLLLALRSADATRAVDGIVLPDAEEALQRALIGVGGERELNLPWIATNGNLTINQKKLAVSRGPSVYVYDVPTSYRDELKAMMVLSGGKRDINVVSFSPDGRYLATAGEAGTQLWDVPDGKLRRRLIPKDLGTQTVIFSPNSGQILTGGKDGSASLWDTATGRGLHRFMGHEKAVRTLTFNATGSRIATGSADKMAILWESVSGTALMKFGPHEDVVNRVAFSPDGQHLATASGFEVRIWDTQSGRMVQRLEGQLGTITAVLFVPPDGSTLVTGSLDGSARVWDAATGRLLLAITMGPDDRIYGLAVTAEGDHIATLGYTPQGVMIRVFPLALDHLVSVAKSLVTRTFTDEECRKYLHIDHCNGK
jgi:hypothetical protein